MKQTIGNKKSNAVILAIVGAVIILIGVLCLIASGEEAEPSGGWKRQTKEEVQEELDNMGLAGGILLVIGLAVEGVVIYKGKSVSSSVTNETETLDRYEKRLKELNENLQNNKITVENFEERKNKILDDLVNEINTLDILKKRIKEMCIDGVISEEDSKKMLDKIGNDVKKAKNKKTNIICIAIIIFLVVITIISIINESKNKRRLGIGKVEYNISTKV